MPLIVSDCGDFEANGCYYQEQSFPPKYVQTNRKHCICLEAHHIALGYGGSYTQSMWVLQRTDGYQCTALWMAPQTMSSNANPDELPRSTIKWKATGGSGDAPKVRNGAYSNNSDKMDVRHCLNNRSMNSCSMQSRKRSFHMFQSDHQEPQEATSEFSEPIGKKRRFNDSFPASYQNGTMFEF
mmetsp:Transcript_2690/g.5093  ORF Transcript_2690/g.5093 Transcript_2690/m.5093 type:complete len:183 (-) Transcript_2690:250-798(-)|eukprot:CAMPEP_0202712896 /NCGR_PEP_ID=MMETSP1385-20130828/47555_1 /ASSEMBLY_ACC=CAM_ASM_000861 /TAXON_ID=933848 /ORGANISM="Elphidium margaritaceum" /LENGTH=182 /DNA_ID=CAMNT_0049373087 /DNA_START=104 /DNA_END=652 /DNA_ORIENTATION=-